jgi:hypothetical protein
LASNPGAQLYYARWKDGEIGIVSLDATDQQPRWAVEVKWIDRPYQARQELENCITFAHQNPGITQPILITSKTLSDEDTIYKDVHFQFQPSSLCAYILGVNLPKGTDYGRHVDHGLYMDLAP